MGKKQTFQSFSNILGEKICENTNISKLSVSEMFSLDAEIHAVPKIWEKWISIIQEKHEKTQTFQIYGFLNYFE